MTYVDSETFNNLKLHVIRTRSVRCTLFVEVVLVVAVVDITVVFVANVFIIHLVNGLNPGVSVIGLS